jgi:anti-anti-sigma factor
MWISIRKEQHVSKHFRVERHDEFLVVYFLDASIHGELAIASLGDDLYAIVGRPDCSNLVLNLSGVEFLSSAMLGKLISVRKMMAQKGGTLTLCELCPNIRTIFRLTHLDRLLDIRDTETETLRL